MIEIGYSGSSYDSCVYYHKLIDGYFIYIVLYVNDMFLVAKKKSGIQKLKEQLSTKFEMKDLGAAKKILGIEIYMDRRQKKLFLAHKDIFKRFYQGLE
jgi:hypothetical protein